MKHHLEIYGYTKNIAGMPFFVCNSIHGWYVFEHRYNRPIIILPTLLQDLPAMKCKYYDNDNP